MGAVERIDPPGLEAPSPTLAARATTDERAVLCPGRSRTIPGVCWVGTRCGGCPTSALGDTLRLVGTSPTQHHPG